jgi:hypothetical protein
MSQMFNNQVGYISRYFSMFLLIIVNIILHVFILFQLKENLCYFRLHAELNRLKESYPENNGRNKIE